ncbi:hypothetical protein W59_29680 [Rhodococcus opacus RKJ300 = JCM 13270]|uniref:Rv2525c-like glycoside hydrolase-like domain-containing protein n=1 Tax=Rhodococcus opacus RKJ300 = JCM 13270 TaxID=1165867 RepID=I0WF20_RHOOP|nr:hypothetical protein W59_29680 [Rhodococcus opacus RKJ300 = JCM 13270]
MKVGDTPERDRSDTGATVQISRRDLFRYAAAGSAVAGIAALTSTTSSVAVAKADSLGILIDYAGGVPSADAILEAGYAGAIRYLSDRRPGAEWMEGKPMLADEAQALLDAGLSVVSCYQFGKGPTADWRGGLEAGKRHAERGLELHLAAGGSEDRPIYASIDDNPTPADFLTMIAPYLAGWESVVGKANTGIYANSTTLDLAVLAGLGSWYWQHDWGTPEGYVHPSAHLHQYEIDASNVDGVGIDLNDILKPDYGQW